MECVNVPKGRGKGGKKKNPTFIFEKSNYFSSKVGDLLCCTAQVYKKRLL